MKLTYGVDSISVEQVSNHFQSVAGTENFRSIYGGRRHPLHYDEIDSIIYYELMLLHYGIFDWRTTNPNVYIDKNLRRLI